VLAVAVTARAASAVDVDYVPLAQNAEVTIRATDRAAQTDCLLSVMGGELRFEVSRRAPPPRGAAPDPPDRARAPEASYRFRVTTDGSLLKVANPPARQSTKEGWYLSADYSANPPQVVLTQAPTEYSHWRFVNIKWSGNEGFDACIKNDNDLGKDAWLNMEDKGVFYREGIEARKPVLSYKNKSIFYVEEQPASK
jgi:hypothetical protein